MTNRGGHLSDAELLLELIRQSEEDLRRGHWVSQEQLEKQFHERFGIESKSPNRGS
jgi:hypothetical protein